MTTLLPPVEAPEREPSGADDEASWRSLDEVGAAAILGAMVEQRRRASSDLPGTGEAFEADPTAPPWDDSDAIATQRRERIAPGDDVFQKIR